MLHFLVFKRHSQIKYQFPWGRNERCNSYFCLLGYTLHQLQSLLCVSGWLQRETNALCDSVSTRMHPVAVSGAIGN
jgi:hypothetical protein